MDSPRRSLPSAALLVGPLIFICAISCFSVLMFGSLVDYQHSPLRSNLSSRNNRDLAAAAFALSAPILMEIIIKTANAFSADRKSRKVAEHMRKPLLSSTELFLLISAILSCHITAFLPSDTPNMMNIFHCARRCRSILTAGAINLSFCRHDAKFWSVRSSTAILLLNISSNIVASLHDNISPLYGNKAIKMMSGAAYFIAALIFIVNTFRWFISISPLLLRTIRNGCRLRDKNICADRDSSHDGYYFYPSLYIVATSASYLILTMIFWVYPDWDPRSFDSVFFHNLVITLYLFLIIIISDRVMKHEIIQGLVSELDTFIWMIIAHLHDHDHITLI